MNYFFEHFSHMTGILFVISGRYNAFFAIPKFEEKWQSQNGIFCQKKKKSLFVKQKFNLDCEEIL